MLDSLLQTLQQADTGVGTIALDNVLMMLALSAAIGHIVAWIYMATHGGLSYSRAFVMSLVALPVIVSLVMTLMSGSIYIAFGLLAVFAVVRFRNVLKDTRDTTFVLWAIIEGLSVGSMKYGTAIVGAAFIGLLYLYLYWASFGHRMRYDVVLSVKYAGELSGAATLRPILKQHSRRTDLAGERPIGSDLWDLSYRLLMRDPARSQELVGQLEGTPGVEKVSLFRREDEAEV